ncbi:ABC-three component system protein [Neobacillus jeddahensis]|uniref:ABC-three component system protein n=1 Tax=Neobacillus jeddahensis TaxID=1461580 RepID=UPI00058D7CD7|nr:ABC-three component system protein [Neobacillus jeddahensis]
MDIVEDNVAIEKLDTHSAVPTWSGFDYQGQVSIYWVMKQLNQMDLSSIQLKDYELQIESLEDFSINHKGYPLTIHQVKAYQDKATFGKFKRAIHDLLGKCAKYPAITLCYLHTCHQIEMPEEDAFKTELEGIKSEKNKLQLVEYNNLLFKEGKYDETIEKLLLNQAEGNEFRSVIGRLEIEDEIKRQIRMFLEKNNELCKYEFVESDENINFIYFNFIHEINQLVAKGHADKEKDNSISFSTFVDILTNEYVFAFTEKTAASMLKNILSAYFAEFCEKFDLEPEDCLAWKENWEWICRLNDHDFLLLCKKLTPTVNANTKKLEAIILRELIVKAGAHKTLFPLVMSSGHFALKIEGVKEMFVLNKEGIHHLITTIAETWGKNEAANQGKKIFEALKNDNQLTYLLFDVNKVITNELEGPFEGKIVDAGHDFENVIPGFEEKDTITKYKRMHFMKVETAMEVFKS